MEKRTLLVVLAVALLLVHSACASATPEPTATPQPTDTPEPTPTISPTDTPEPTPTSTPIPLSEIALEPLLIQDGDLPAGLSGAQVRSSLTEMYDKLPAPDSAIQRQFQRDGEAAGFVTVLLYESPTDLDAAYADIVGGFGESTRGPGFETRRETVSNIGDQAEAVTVESEVEGISLEGVDLAFSRCHAVVHARIMGTLSLLDIESYAKRLDERLAPVVCH